jgi:PAS domain S-box-containing protein
MLNISQKAAVTPAQDQASTQELALLADRITDAVVVCDAQRSIRWANPAFTRLTGFLLEEAQGCQIEELLSGPQTDPEAVMRITQALARGEGIEHVPMCQHHRNGEAFWVERTIQPLVNPDGHIDRYIEVMTDLRSQRWAQQEHHRRLEAEVALARRSTFLGQLSHGMRGPLNTIVGFSQLLEMEVSGSMDARRHLGNIQQAAQQLLQLLDKAITLANAEDRVLAVHAQRVNLTTLSKEVCHQHESLAREQRITQVIEGECPSAWGDPVHIKTILQALVRFSISHCQHEGTVWVSCRQVADTHRAVLEVSHPGDGLTHVDGARIFQPFTPATMVSSHSSQGSLVDDGDQGMSLAIAQRLAELMNGTLSVNSALGKGCTFTLSLPLADKLSVREEQASGLPAQRVRLPALRIIHVEDNALNRSLMESLFTAHPEVQLSAFPTATQGLQAIQGELPDVALIDINLPDGSGLDMCKALRASPTTRRIPLIALSADALPDHIAQALQTGFNHYLVKPIQIQRLLSILATMKVRGPHE